MSTVSPGQALMVEQDQATIWATLTDTTPATITALLTDPV